MPTTETSAAPTDALAVRITQHLEDEERTLAAVLLAVRELHQSLRELDGEALAQALRSETTALHEAEKMQHRRQQMRDATASELGLTPQNFTLGLMAQKTTGSLHQSIVESRRRLAEMAAEMERLNRQNAAMIQQSMMLIRGVIGRLTRTAGNGESYNAGGVREETHVGALVEWGG